jgi:hypothetical protein
VIVCDYGPSGCCGAIVDPMNYQRHAGERFDPPAPLRTLHFGPHREGLVAFLVYPPHDVSKSLIVAGAMLPAHLDACISRWLGASLRVRFPGVAASTSSRPWRVEPGGSTQ